jgi:hypothetical protein
VIALQELFQSTLSQTSVYPRKVVKRALAQSAAAVILAHNHPSDVAEPSQSNQVLTSVLNPALAMEAVHVLDHFAVAMGQMLSFAAKELDLVFANGGIHPAIHPKIRPFVGLTLTLIGSSTTIRALGKLIER